MCKYLWWWLLHGSGHLCKMLTYMHPMCVSDELYGLCKRTAITKRRMSNNVRSRVSYVIKPSMHLDGESRMALLCFVLSCFCFCFSNRDFKYYAAAHGWWFGIRIQCAGEHTSTLDSDKYTYAFWLQWEEIAVTHDIKFNNVNAWPPPKQAAQTKQ